MFVVAFIDTAGRSRAADAVEHDRGGAHTSNERTNGRNSWWFGIDIFGGVRLPYPATT